MIPTFIIMSTLRPQHALAAAIALCMAWPAMAQKPDAAKDKVHDGVELHDQHEYKKALKKYDEALKLDADNPLAMAEKALTLNAMGELEKSAALCQEIILKHNSARDMPMVYVTYGNCMDQLGRPEASLRVYEEGIRIIPQFYMLHFNKGVTLNGMDSLASAHLALQRSARLNPYHPGTQALLAEVLEKDGNIVPATLAICRLLVLESEGERARRYLSRLQRLTTGNVSKEKNGSTTIYIDAGSLDALEDTVLRENDFRKAEASMSLLGSLNMAALITDALNKEGVKTPATNAATRMESQLGLLASTLKADRAENYGFYWDYHASWFIALNDAGHLGTMCYLANAESDDKAVRTWLNTNGDKVDDYYTWEKEHTARFLKEK